ncbi:MAG: glycosylase [Lachnospiraceae bacterium]|nr:glycosylase [Lachnospiraceae bacterium]
MGKGPLWLENAVFYEIYPQSFKDTDADGIGNIDGITEKLPYIRELGCTGLWINPCFESPFGDAGYDVSDYRKVAQRYGTNEDLFRLFEEAHKLGIHVLLDLVPGHTSWKHPWFIESMKAEKNEYTDRYVWTDSIWEEPKGYGSLRGISPRNGSCAVNFFTHQPALNYGFYKPERPWQQPVDAEGPLATREAMKDVMRFWLEHGCDGFRVDMAGSLVKNDEDGKGTIALWQDIRAFLDREFPDSALVSEWGEPDKSLQGGFHMDFLLHFGPSHYNDLFRCEEPFFKGTGDASEFVAKYTENYERSERKGLICIPSGNHDMIRLAKYLNDEELRLAFAFLLSMPGAPFLYYGDEIGMRYVENLTSVEGGYERTGSRSPMQWDKSRNAGFSDAPSEALYIPLDPDPERPTAEGMMNDPASLRNYVKDLIRMRNAHPALGNLGEISFVLDGRKGHPLVYLRSRGDEKILVVQNPASSPAVIRFDGTPEKELFRFGGDASFSEGSCTVSGRSALFLLLSNQVSNQVSN